VAHHWHQDARGVARRVSLLDDRSVQCGTTNGCPQPRLTTPKEAALGDSARLSCIQIEGSRHVGFVTFTEKCRDSIEICRRDSHRRRGPQVKQLITTFMTFGLLIEANNVRDGSRLDGLHQPLRHQPLLYHALPPQPHPLA
jgi:hypothetical protein